MIYHKGHKEGTKNTILCELRVNLRGLRSQNENNNSLQGKVHPNRSITTY